MDFTFTVQYDPDYTPWGEPEIVAEETEKINNHEWVPVILTTSVVGPVESTASIGSVVELCEQGTYDSVDKIPDAHLRELAREHVQEIESDYLLLLARKRDEINALIQQMGGN